MLHVDVHIFVCIYVQKCANLRPPPQAKSFLRCFVPGRRHGRLISTQSVGKPEPSESTAPDGNSSTVFRCHTDRREAPTFAGQSPLHFVKGFSPARTSTLLVSHPPGDDSTFRKQVWRAEPKAPGDGTVLLICAFSLNCALKFSA